VLILSRVLRTLRPVPSALSVAVPAVASGFSNTRAAT
jgi:hypothetical protein